MPARDQGLLEALSQWVTKADNDLLSAAVLLKLGARCPTDTTCFHAQQCVEKYLKALLVLRGIPFAKTHNIRLLINMLGSQVPVDLEASVLDRLTDYATVSRYPGEEETISLTEARQAVRIARRVRSEIRRFLPKRALRR